MKQRSKNSWLKTLTCEHCFAPCRFDSILFINLPYFCHSSRIECFIRCDISAAKNIIYQEYNFGARADLGSL
jgi:hypothetical protein